MPNKKSDEPEQSADEQALVNRVDAMMSTELPKGKTSKDKASAEPPIVIELADESKTSAESISETKPDSDETKPKPDAAPEEILGSEDTATKTSESQTEPAQDQDQASSLLENSGTDKAVDDIVAHESDTVLAVNDALTAREHRIASSEQTHGGPIKHKWLWFLVLIVLIGTAIDVLIFKSG